MPPMNPWPGTDGAPCRNLGTRDNQTTRSQRWSWQGRLVSDTSGKRIRNGRPASQRQRHKRLYLTKIAQKTDLQEIQALRGRPLPAECGVGSESGFRVHFRSDHVCPLAGDTLEK